MLLLYVVKNLLCRILFKMSVNNNIKLFLKYLEHVERASFIIAITNLYFVRVLNINHLSFTALCKQATLLIEIDYGNQSVS